ncbi:MAG: FMN-dependent NADH-azoreductase [Sediminibacterium sp.]|jgi:FMN-dependent NADH-azoreductase|nr:NAD(P)H-dependent oxidoreductase [Chitinophagaceae bacterium]MCA6445981.1 NAD(P)H-dependent oxidoreductase [Chitinophagaceae bacterium]
MGKNILVIKSSPRGANSVSNQLTDALTEKLKGEYPDANFTSRDISTGLPFVTEKLIQAFYSDPATHTEDFKQEVAISDELVNELLANEIIVIGLPLYNFTVPAALKAYIDLIVRAGITFKFNGPGQYEGLVHGKKVYLVLATGGAPIGSPYDNASAYLKNILGFLGITDVTVLGASGTNIPEVVENAIKEAKEEIAELVLA